MQDFTEPRPFLPKKIKSLPCVPSRNPLHCAAGNQQRNLKFCIHSFSATVGIVFGFILRTV